MSDAFRRFACALAACLSLQAAAASPTLRDFSDLWSVPAESGWGAHLTLQDDILFLVLYVHDAASEPRFFVATDMRPTAQSTPEQPIFAGTLYRPAARSPCPYDCVALQASRWEMQRCVFTPRQRALSYDVQGASVTKRHRQTFRVGALRGIPRRHLPCRRSAAPRAWADLASPTRTTPLSQAVDAWVSTRIRAGIQERRLPPERTLVKKGASSPPHAVLVRANRGELHGPAR